MKRNYILQLAAKIFLLFIFTHTLFAQTDTASIAFVSDTQAPIFIEKLWLNSNNNEKATQAIFNELTHSDISAVFHLGDITSIGFLPGSWKQMKKYFLSLQLAGVPVYPALGNHEYLIFPSSGEKMFFKNFPQISSSWYVKRFGNAAVIILNSNFSHLTDEQISEQLEWFKNEIILLNLDPEVKFILVAAHHSPFTNSKIVSPSSEVRRLFLPIFFANPKCKVFLSGHAHTFEHFKVRGKDFLVIGGGGGLLHPLMENPPSPDLYKSEKRTFHYVICRQINDSIQFSIRMINPDYQTFTEVYSLKLTSTQ